jgi:hypothetical protein
MDQQRLITCRIKNLPAMQLERLNPGINELYGHLAHALKLLSAGDDVALVNCDRVRDRHDGNCRAINNRRAWSSIPGQPNKCSLQLGKLSGI